MGQLRIEEILKSTGGRILSGDEKEFTGLSIDSRTIRPGELFVALKGERFDGHAFLRSALQKGSGAMVEASPAESFGNKAIIDVPDTLLALQSLARYRLLQADIPVAAVTGTNGKTTTKELLASIFGCSGKVLKTQGNLNNHIGLPLCVARMDGDEGVAVLEMGSNAAGDIDLLCRIAAPRFAVVTNVGPAHLEGFGSLEAVRGTDLEILKYVDVVSVNADDQFLMEGLEGFAGEVVTYGMDSNAQVRAKDVTLGEGGASFKLCFRDGIEMPVRLGIAGAFNVRNALAAASLAGEMGAAREDIVRGLELFRGVPMRMEIRRFMGALAIGDVYNANPASMESALKELVRLAKGRSIAVLGDMLELGSYSDEAHTNMVRRLSESGVDIFIAVGPAMARACSEFAGSCYRADDADRARETLLGLCREGDTILVKGSRGMHMERVLAVPEGPGTGEDSHAL